MICEDTKLCTKCRETKVLSEFSNYKRGSKGKGSYCKSCAKKYMRQYQKDNKSYFCESSKKQRIAHKKKNQSKCIDLDYKKVCCRCEIYKNSSEYSSDVTRFDGLTSACKSCLSKENTKKYWDNREEWLARNKKYKDRMSEEDKKEMYKKSYQRMDKVKLKAYHLEYRVKNRSLINKNSREYKKKRKMEDPNFRKAEWENRRARELSAEGVFSDKEFNILCQHFENCCVKCGRNDVKLSADHVIPLSKGGSNYISNIQPLCISCNCQKHTKTVDYRKTFYYEVI